MKKIIVKIKNFLRFKGTYNWALEEMSKGGVIKSCNHFSNGYCIFYYYEINSLMVLNANCKAFPLCNEKEYKLNLIDDFYVTTLKIYLYNDSSFVKNMNAERKETLNESNNLFK